MSYQISNNFQCLKSRLIKYQINIMKNTIKFFVIIAIIASFVSCRKEKEWIEEIYDNPGYAIGEITHYISIPLVVTYHYAYYVNGSQYEGKKKSRGIGQDKSELIGKLFLVVYKKSNPEESDLNFDYLIESEADFEDLLEEFESFPPEP